MTAAGGTVLRDPVDVFDMGRFAVAADPSGAAFSLRQPQAFEGAGLFSAPGALGWTELLTREPRERATSARPPSAGPSPRPSATPGGAWPARTSAA
ncbi:hypothetical protein GCM10020295_09580 [Streptomyces cinereospinus]